MVLAVVGFAAAGIAHLQLTNADLGSAFGVHDSARAAVPLGYKDGG